MSTEADLTGQLADEIQTHYRCYLRAMRAVEAGYESQRRIARHMLDKIDTVLELLDDIGYGWTPEQGVHKLEA